MDRLIVDGYNVIFAWPELVGVKDASLEDARTLLIGILADYAALTRQKVTVVFDSHRAGGGGSQEEISGVQVIFSGGKASADHVIERLIFEARPGDEVMVATSDAVQRDLALGKSVKTISALALRSQVQAALARRDAHMRNRQAHSDLARRLEDRLDPKIRERLERLRRGE